MKLATEMSTLPKSAGMDISEIEWVAFEPAKDSLQFKQIVRAYWMLWAFIVKWKARRIGRNKRRAEGELENDVRAPKRTNVTSDAYKTTEVIAKSSAASPLTPSVSSRGMTPS